MSERTEIYKNITIYANNVGERPKAEVDNEFRLVKLAIDRNWVTVTPAGKDVNQIKIIGTTHTTTQTPHGPVKDQSHLTLSVNPGKMKAHLYLKPVDGEKATEHTTLDRLTW